MGDTVRSHRSFHWADTQILLSFNPRSLVFSFPKATNTLILWVRNAMLFNLVWLVSSLLRLQERKKKCLLPFLFWIFSRQLEHCPAVLEITLLIYAGDDIVPFLWMSPCICTEAYGIKNVSDPSLHSRNVWDGSPALKGWKKKETWVKLMK